MFHRFCLVGAVLFVLCGLLHADPWRWESIRRFDPPAGCWIDDVAFDGPVGLAVNGLHHVFISRDNAANWSAYDARGLMSGSANLATCALSGRQMVAGGENALIYSLDSGHSWRRSNVPLSGQWTIRAIDFDPRDPSKVAAVGAQREGNRYRARVLLSNDSGATWTQAAAPSTGVLLGIRYRPSGRSVICGNGGVFVSTNGCRSWSTVSSPALRGTTPECLFSRRSHVWIGCARGLIAHSADGGSTWQRLSIGTTRTIRDLAFLSASVGIAVSPPNHIYHTVDGGRTWEADNVSAVYQNLGCATVRRAGSHYFLVGGRRFDIPVVLADQNAVIPLRPLEGPVMRIRYRRAPLLPSSPRPQK